MSLKPEPIPPVPEETIRVARAAFPKGNQYMTMRDVFGTIYTDDVFAELFPRRGQSAVAPWRLVLVTIMQFAEGLSDRQAAERVRDSIAWKYALSLELTDTGFDASVLSEFRSRLVEGDAEQKLLDPMLGCFLEKGLLKARGQQRTDATHILAAVRALNRLECVGETMRHTLNVLSRLIPEWVKTYAPSAWYERYEKRYESFRLPKTKAQQLELAETIGNDGLVLLNALYADETRIGLDIQSAVQTLRRVWIQNFYFDESGQLRWREDDNLPPSSLLIRSPYDIEARVSQKRETVWLGYKAHLTEVCDPDMPHLIVHVETTSATTMDNQVVDTVHSLLAHKGLLPDEHLVDTGYVDALNIVASQQTYRVDLIGPAMPDVGWQAREKTGYDVSRFMVNWQRKVVICPEGKESVYWYEVVNRNGEPAIDVRFSVGDCHPCSAKPRCARSQTRGRMLYLRPQVEHEALQQRRREQETDTFKEKYRRRAGIEGTVSQGVRVCEMRRSRYIGLAKTHLQHLITAVALNLIRVIEWLKEPEFAQTRISPFMRLAA